jgi:hypothetical protein
MLHLLLLSADFGRKKTNDRPARRRCVKTGQPQQQHLQMWQGSETGVSALLQLA